MAELKEWWRSKTLWVNIIAFGALLIQSINGFVIDPVEQAAFITILNLALRLATKTGLE